jgi:hypothetical protein
MGQKKENAADQYSAKEHDSNSFDGEQADERSLARSAHEGVPKVTPED